MLPGAGCFLVKGLAFSAYQGGAALLVKASGRCINLRPADGQRTDFGFYGRDQENLATA